MYPPTSLNEPTDDLMGGRVPLRQLIDAEAVPFKDLKCACAWLDALGVPFIRVHSRRFYRRTDILRAINRSEIRPQAV